MGKNKTAKNNLDTNLTINNNATNENVVNRKRLSPKVIKAAKADALPFIGVGVDISRMNKPFKASFYAEGKKQHLGYFETAISAAMAYNKKSKVYFTSTALAKKAKKWNVLPKNIN